MSATLTLQKMALDQVSFPGYRFAITGSFDGPAWPYLHAEFFAPCSRTGLPRLQRTRKWLLAEHMTADDIVQLAFQCVQASIEHGLREQFVYMGAPVFSPRLHLADVAGLWAERHRPTERRTA